MDKARAPKSDIMGSEGRTVGLNASAFRGLSVSEDFGQVDGASSGWSEFTLARELSEAAESGLDGSMALPLSSCLKSSMRAFCAAVCSGRSLVVELSAPKTSLKALRGLVLKVRAGSSSGSSGMVLRRLRVRLRSVRTSFFNSCSRFSTPSGNFESSRASVSSAAYFDLVLLRLDESYFETPAFSFSSVDSK